MDKIVLSKKIEEIVIDYQKTVTEYFEAEVPMDNDADSMDHFLSCLKNEILELLK